ncbi:replication initiation protein [Nocardioides immobilis]|uniref:Replication initiation protein n=1 Tax=Nocardioides immobilis TaxID=2049295 RepID=A0A417XZS0_9ACTN|nr:replication initiation protein [Nocardioides immobilis]
MTTTLVQAAADTTGVCRRPLLRKVTDRATGQVASVPIPCGSTRATVCPACADRARRVRMHQCREGWHLVDDPLPPSNDEDTEDDPDESRDDDGDDGADRRVRSTRRLPGFPDLPKVPVEHVSIGRTFTDPRTGATFRPSMFVTLTLPSYGRIAPGTGVPADPSYYDYRHAALDALHFPRLVDRWWQNLRRCAGYKVQYFASVEAQRRLAPHLHTALRGSIPRATLRGVTAGTYCALWWPDVDTVRYDADRGDELPAWDPVAQGYYDPTTGALLPSWDQALDDIDGDEFAEPMHVLRFGDQVDIKGILGGTEETHRAVAYLCKYLTKAVAETYTDPDHPNPAYEAHIDRLHAEVRWLPCSESCSNWLRFGVTPKDPGSGMVPGMCPSKAHDRECLGLGGRRVLVSRHWTGKTLTEHRADRAAVVRAVLEEAGIDAPEARRLAADVLHSDGQPRFVWEDVPVEERSYGATIAASLRQRRDWREQYERAKEVARAGPAS